MDLQLPMLCNLFLWPIKLWIRIPLMARCTLCICDKACQYILQYNCNIVESGAKHHSYTYFLYVLFIREIFWSSRMNLGILYIHCYLYNNINAYSQIFLHATAIYKMQLIPILIKLIPNCETCVNRVKHSYLRFICVSMSILFFFKSTYLRKCLIFWCYYRGTWGVSELYIYIIQKLPIYNGGKHQRGTNVCV